MRLKIRAARCHTVGPRDHVDPGAEQDSYGTEDEESVLGWAFKLLTAVRWTAAGNSTEHHRNRWPREPSGPDQT